MSIILFAKHDKMNTSITNEISKVIEMNDFLRAQLQSETVSEEIKRVYWAQLRANTDLLTELYKHVPISGNNNCNILRK